VGRARLKPSSERPPLDGALADRIASVFLLAAAALVAARAVLTFVPTMWAWSLNLQRFLSPAWAWAPWALAAASLLPAVARRLLPAFQRAGDQLRAGGLRNAIATAAEAAVLVLLLPDRVRYVGDSLLRQSTLRTPGALAAQWYPQAMPLDIYLHDTLGRAAMAAIGIGPDAVARLLGALEAALLALLVAGFVRALRLRGAAAIAAASVVFFGGYLTLFTGYNKGFSELCLVIVALGGALVNIADGGTRLMALAVPLAVGLLIHRSILAALPAVIVAAVIVMRRWSPADWRRPGNLLAVAIGGGALATTLPRILGIIHRIDSMHLTPDEVKRHGFLAAIVAEGRGADVLNLIVMMSPLVLAVPLVALLAGGWLVRQPRLQLLALLALPFLGAVLIVHPGQGVFRDWDDFCAAGVSFSLIVAWLAGETLGGARTRAWLAVPLVAAVAVPAVQWLAHASDLDRGLARAHAFVTEPPRHADWYETSTWEYLGIRNDREERWPASAAAYREAARRLPSPNLLRQLAAAETHAGEIDSARAVYRFMLSRNPNDDIAWLGLAVLSFRLADYAEAKRAAQELLRIHPDDRNALALLDRIARVTAAVADSTRP
jgi:hypothetical protein